MCYTIFMCMDFCFVIVYIHMGYCHFKIQIHMAFQAATLWDHYPLLLVRNLLKVWGRCLYTEWPQIFT